MQGYQFHTVELPAGNVPTKLDNKLTTNLSTDMYLEYSSDKKGRVKHFILQPFHIYV